MIYKVFYNLGDAKVEAYCGEFAHEAHYVVQVGVAVVGINGHTAVTVESHLGDVLVERVTYGKHGKRISLEHYNAY